LKKQDLEAAKSEFLKDGPSNPTWPITYDQLGLIAYLQQQDAQAKEHLKHALQLNNRLTSAHFELARVYQRDGNSRRRFRKPTLP